ncbi:Glycosyltransferase Family 4 [Cetobacterium ceti]|uniref:Glycosyltransferase Family 4 n=1 Tax=Cetobacterium ceti TaxID=180163 RepID=A0A1T4LRP2_9FUSO|nr:glycosyltransferase [Cetobacterium ceti]SJZ57412.1 Glycosyltransferase Family 4 [Cetobacterium ceti]
MKKNVVIRSGSLRMGGLERVLIEVLQNIDRNKFNLHLIIEDDCGEDNIFQRDIPEDLEYSFLKPKKLRDFTEYFKNRKKNIFYKMGYNLMMTVESIYTFYKLKRLLKNMGNIDVLVDYDTGASKYIDKLNVKKKIGWIHNSIPNLKRKESKIKRYGKRLDKYDHIVAICDEMKEEIESIYPFLRGRVSRIYNPFNFNRINSLSLDKSQCNKRDLEMLQERYYIGVSRLDTNQKDYDTLLKGYKRALEKGMKEKLYIVGDGPSKKEIKDKIEELGLKNSVYLLGQKKNPYIWIKNSLGFVHSSKFEGFGLVLVEAQILGKSVISSNCPVGPREILGNGEYGLIYKVGDFQELSEKFLEISNNESLRKSYEEKSKIRAKDFNSNGILREYENLIEGIN